MTANQVCRISISDAMTANTHAMFFCLARKLQTHIRHFCVWRKAYAAHDVWALQSPSTEGLYMRLLRLARKLQMHIRHFCVWRENFKCTFHLILQPPHQSRPKASLQPTRCELPERRPTNGKTFGTARAQANARDRPLKNSPFEIRGVRVLDVTVADRHEQRHGGGYGCLSQSEQDNF